MSHPHRHIIRKLSVQAACAGQSSGLALHGQLGEVLELALANELQALFDTVGDVRMERLDLDLGFLPEKNWEQALREKLRQQLGAALRPAPAQGPAAADPDTNRPTAEKDDALMAWLYFLRTGRLPWWAEHRRLAAIEQALLEKTGLLAAKNADQLRVFFRRHPQAISRLVHQSNENLLSRLWVLLKHPQAPSVLFGPKRSKDVQRLADILSPYMKRASAEALLLEAVFEELAATLTEASWPARMARIVSQRLQQRLPANPLLEGQLNQWGLTYRKKQTASAAASKRDAGRGAETNSDREGPTSPPPTPVEKSTAQKRDTDSGAEVQTGKPATAEKNNAEQEQGVTANAETGTGLQSPTQKGTTAAGKGALQNPALASPDTGTTEGRNDPGNRPEKPGSLPEPLADEPFYYVANAGLALLHPFVAAFFENRGLQSGGRFRSDETRAAAVQWLHFLATGQPDCPEPELVFPKILCGLPLEAPVARRLEQDASGVAEADGLLTAVVGHWKDLKNTSPAGLREGFLNRAGKLEPLADYHYRLTVERQSMDILLEQLPWSIGIIRLPWMQGLLYVEW